jgi:molecular chaperone DnaK
MALAVGIDLGTTNSVISVYRRGRAETLLVEGSTTTPSAVCFRDKRTTLVGRKTLGMALIRPESTILSVKRKMGLADFRYTIHGDSYSPVDISALVIKKLCESHEDTLGGPPEHAVITVPAYFTDDQRRDTKLAAEQAGLNVLRLLPEPTAAAVAIGLDKGRDQTILVYDLGGGTFDVSILKVENNDFRVLAVNGNHDLGGNDFDQQLRDHALDAFKDQTKIDLRAESKDDPDVRRAMQVLTAACERVKMELSEAEKSDLDLPNFFKGQHLETTIDRRTFEGLIKDLVFQTKDLIVKTLSEAKLGVDDIDRLVLVGGSTKVPLVQRVIADTVKEPYVADNVDLVVSHGAAIMAANLYAIEEHGEDSPDYAPVPVDCRPAEINVTDVVSHPISVALANELAVMECQVVIRKNEPLPATGMAVGSTGVPFQPMGVLPVFRGGVKDPQKNHVLGDLQLTFTPRADLIPLRFELTLDENGVLLVEGAEIDLEEISPEALMWTAPEQLKVKRRVRAEIKMPD